MHQHLKHSPMHESIIKFRRAIYAITPASIKSYFIDLETGGANIYNITIIEDGDIDYEVIFKNLNNYLETEGILLLARAFTEPDVNINLVHKREHWTTWLYEITKPLKTVGTNYYGEILISVTDLDYTIYIYLRDL